MPPSPPPRALAPALRKLYLQVDCISCEIDPELAFSRLYRKSGNAFWLDSSDQSNSNGRFSFMGDDSGPLARVLTASVAEQRLTVRTNEKIEKIRSGVFDWLRADLERLTISQPVLPFDFALGWVGYLGYELKQECGVASPHRSEQPDSALIFADRGLVFDHKERSVYLLALTESQDTATTSEWVAATRLTLEDLMEVAKTEAPPSIPSVTFTLKHSHDAYLAHIHHCKEKINQGESYELCLTNQLQAQASVDPWQVYLALRRKNPVPYAAWLHFDEIHVLSGSPERFMRISKQGAIESKPIKGTRPRGANPESDRNYRHELVTSEKERAENLMIVDLVRNDLGRCAEIGSVRVSGLFEVESYSTVHQLVSTVRAQLSASCTSVDCVRAAFPGGSMTGAPKRHSVEILDELEAGPRGIYSGVLGYFSPNGAVDLSIIIRTLVVTPNRITFGVGGAITALSNPEEEFEETAIKARSLLQIFDSDFPR